MAKSAPHSILHHHNKPNWSKFFVLWACAGLLRLALVVDVIWASSSSFTSAYKVIASNFVVEKSAVIVVPNVAANKSDAPEDNVVAESVRILGSSERKLSATFADIPAPEWSWEQMPSAPVPRLDGYAIQIKNLFYVFSGYANLNHVS